MSAYALLEEIRACLEPALATLPLPVHGRDRQGAPVVPKESGISAPEGESVRCAAIHLGSMPPTANDAFSAAPFVVIQPLKGFDDDEGHSNIQVVVRLCIVSDDLEEAENDLHNLISLIRRTILSLPGGVVGQGAYRLVPLGGETGKAPWERPDEQVLPFLQAHIFTVWQTQGVCDVAV